MAEPPGAAATCTVYQAGERGHWTCGDEPSGDISVRVEVGYVLNCGATRRLLATVYAALCPGSRSRIHILRARQSQTKSLEQLEESEIKNTLTKR